MKYFFTFISLFYISKSFSQSYILLSGGVGISQTSQIAIQIQPENQNINSLGSSIKILCGYQFKKTPLSVETGLILHSYAIRFKYNPTAVRQFDVNKFVTFKTFHLPISVKWRLNNNDVGKKKKTQKITCYAKTGASISYYDDYFWKDQLIDYPAEFNEITKSKYQVYNKILTYTQPWGPFVLVHYGLDFTYQYNSKLKLMFGIENNMGFSSILNATFTNIEIQNDKYRSDTNFVISTNGNMQLLNLGLQYTF